MAQLDSDVFTYSNGNLATVSSAKWTKLSGFADLVVASNQVRGANVDCIAVITTWPGSTTDQYAQMVLSTVSGDSGGPAIRCSAVDDGYIVSHIGGTSFRVFKVVNGVFTNIGTGGTPANGDLAYIELQGTTLILKQNGVTRITLPSESSIASGQPGAFSFDAIGLLDSWAAGDFAVSGLTQVYPFAMTQRIG